MEKREKIEEMYFIQKMSLTKISKELEISVSYICRILKQNENYQNEQNKRKAENKLKRREQQKELIYNQRKQQSIQRNIENQVMKRLHEQATREMSKGKVIGKDALRKWCSLYNYNKDKNCYEFDSSKALKPRDFPLCIKV